MRATVPRYLHPAQYLRYWNTRTGTGAWVENTDIEGHAAVCRRARKGDPKWLPFAHYKKTNSRYPIFGIKH